MNILEVVEMLSKLIPYVTISDRQSQSDLTTGTIKRQKLAMHVRNR